LLRVRIEELGGLAENWVGVAEVDGRIALLRFSSVDVVVVVLAIARIEIELNVRLAVEKAFDVLVIGVFS
jgi:uncharacterized small protein (DUF1192 family)